MSEDAENVVTFNLNTPRKDRQPQLSDAELVAVRRMLVDFENIARACPTARYVLDRE